jgi:phosphate transport system substrate-binding protein
MIIKGSNTLGEALIPKMVANYLLDKNITEYNLTVPGKNEKLFEYIEDGINKKILISSHGSSTGFKAIYDSECDLVMASRRISAKDVGENPAISEMHEHIIALDALAIVVNRGNPIRKLTLEQISDIFTGKIKNWSKIDKSFSGNINIYSRDNNSGTYGYFKKQLLRGNEIAGEVQKFEDNTLLANSVASDRYGIGFVPMSSVGMAKAVKVAADEEDHGFIPNQRTVNSEDYLISRRLFLYSATWGDAYVQSRQSTINDFISFVKKGNNSQNTIEEIGFIALKPEMEPVNCEGFGDNTANFSNFCSALQHPALRFTTSIKFEPGSLHFDSKAFTDLENIASILSQPEYENAKVYVLGFSDSQKVGKSTPMVASEERARKVAGELESFGIYPYEVKGCGEVYPSRTYSEVLKQKNCKVEIWISKSLSLSNK